MPRTLPWILALISLFTATTALAGPYIEPFVGYATGKFQHTITLNNTVYQNIDSNMSGMGFGARAGLKGRIFTVGGEYSAATLNFKGGGGVKPKDLGAFVGVFMPGGLRAWGTYVFSTKPEGIKGTGMKFGIGYLMAKYLSLNVEYFSYKYTEITLAQAVGLTINYSGKASGLFFSLSVPFSLF